MKQETKDNLKQWALKVGIVSGVFAILAVVGSFWLWAEFPLPASAMSLEKLEKGQVKNGIKIWSDDIDKVENKIKSLKREKRKWSKISPDDHHVQDDLDDDIDRLRKKLKSSEEKTKKYKERLIELGE